MSPLSFKGRSRPSPPLDASVYVDNQGISVSPTSIGAGLVVFYVTNQASRTEVIKLAGSRRGGTLALNSGELAPNGTATVTADLSEGHYELTGSGARGGHARALSGASLTIGAPRQAGDSALLQP